MNLRQRIEEKCEAMREEGVLHDMTPEEDAREIMDAIEMQLDKLFDQLLE